jgi:hypothetical protein
LLRDASELSHSLSPVFNFVTGARFLVFLALGLGLFKSSLDLLRPLVENALKVLDHFLVNVLGVSLDVLDIWVPLAVVLLKYNVRLDALKGVFELISKLFEHLSELLLLLFFADTPVDRLKAVNERLEDVVDDDVQTGDGVL